MPRKSFHQEMSSLADQVLAMGHLVASATSDAVTALVDEDMKLAEKVVAGDDVIDRLYLDIEEHALAVSARQCPVARDLRLMYSILFISVHLERMGDLALNIAKSVKRVAKAGEIEAAAQITELITDMEKRTIEVVNTSLKAFESRDTELALSLPELDEPIDDQFKDFFKLLSRCSEGEPLDWAGNMLLSSRYLERIADHAVDIGERVLFMVTGEMKELD